MLLLITKIGLALLASFSLTNLAVAAEQPSSAETLRFPSFTWGSVRFPSSLAAEEERSNPLLEGALQQGFDIYSLTNGVFVTPFVHLGLRQDGEGIDWNNEVSAGAGLKLRFLLGGKIRGRRVLLRRIYLIS